MLGDRRSNSLFAAAPSAAPAEARQEQAEVHDISFEENTGRAIFAETKVAPKRAMSSSLPRTRGGPLQRFSARCSPTSPAPMPP